MTDGRRPHVQGFEMQPLTFTHEFDRHGNHRIIASGAGGNIVTEWATYRAAATITIDGDKYMAFTSFWSGTFESDRVYRIVDLPAALSEPANG
jgi:hypothetical protein